MRRPIKKLTEFIGGPLDGESWDVPPSLPTYRVLLNPPPVEIVEPPYEARTMAPRVRVGVYVRRGGFLHWDGEEDT